VFAAKCGPVWAVEVPELRIHTQAESVEDILRMAEEAIAFTLDVPMNSFDLGLEYVDPR
jgi:predicted RNase H-like HicB family nuclease